MNTRSSRSTVTFFNPFSLPGHSGDLHAGDYEVVVEEELLQGRSFVAWRRTATYLTVRGRGSHAGRTEMHAITSHDLSAALSRDQAMIAYEMGLSDNTVKMHLTHIMQKLKVTNRTQVVVLMERRESASNGIHSFQQAPLIGTRRMN